MALPVKYVYIYICTNNREKLCALYDYVGLLRSPIITEDNMLVFDHLFQQENQDLCIRHIWIQMLESNLLL